MNNCSVRDHDAIKGDPARWRALPLVGYQNAGAGVRLELRNCTRRGCGSTLVRELLESVSEAAR